MIENHKEGMIVLECACGMNGVMSLVSLNLYNSVILNHQNNKLSSIFYNMMLYHASLLETFLKLAYSLEMDPRLWVCYPQHNEYWSPSFHNYPRKEDVLVDYAISLHEHFVSYLKGQLINIQEEKTILLFHSIIKEENKFISLLSSFQSLTY